jgi:queuine tRNA-ribosyltransferase/7-cyano-7-deazaguanine tRNA-ribosyltransferase
MFTLQKRDERTNARTGFLSTPHGTIETPAYVIVGTHAEVRTLTPEDIRGARTQVVIANTFHLWQTLGEKLATYTGVHADLGWNGPMMTDSGGFQVFSLGFAREHGVGKIAPMFPDGAISAARPKENLVRVTNDGVFFIVDGKEEWLDAKGSIAIQEKLGADIILAFDECTSPLHDEDYTGRALDRTHRWAKVCLAARTRTDQMLYGIVQGGAYRGLREESARFVGGLQFDGVAIGGSFGREAMCAVLDWTIPFLPFEKPKHLLGIGRIEDLFNGVERGIDTFDCVIPTREARHGSIWTRAGRYDVGRGRYATDSRPLEEACQCATCTGGHTRAELYGLFHAKDMRAGRLATIHNVWFFNHLMDLIRRSIREGRFTELKNDYLSRLV